MRESSYYLDLLKRTRSPAARSNITSQYRIAKAREAVYRVQLPSCTLWSAQGDVEAVAGSDHTTLFPNQSWSRFQADGAIVVWSPVLGEHVVVARDSSVQVPAEYADLACWTLDELRRIRDDLRGGWFRFQTFESINRVKRELGGTVVGTSNTLLAGVVSSVEAPGSPLTGPCLSPARSRRCTSRIAAGEFTAHVTPDPTPEGESRPSVPVCSPCAMRYPWTPAARHAQRVWFQQEGPTI